MEHIDPAAVSPGNYKVVLENEHVRVLEMRLKPGETDEWHTHPSETVYFARGGKVKVHLPEGEPAELDIPDGHVMWHEAWKHRVENAGSTEIFAIIIESRH